jgi:hypothetical protein
MKICLNLEIQEVDLNLWCIHGNDLELIIAIIDSILGFFRSFKLEWKVDMKNFILWPSSKQNI